MIIRLDILIFSPPTFGVTPSKFNWRLGVTYFSHQEGAENTEIRFQDCAYNVSNFSCKRNWIKEVMGPQS
jgi:hypothetical protein